MLLQAIIILLTTMRFLPPPPPPPLAVVTVSLEESEISVNESERMFSTCVVKDRDTVIPLQVEIRDEPLTATTGVGKPGLHLIAWSTYNHGILLDEVSKPFNV